MAYNRTLITAALPYANGPVHIGHLAGVYVPAEGDNIINNRKHGKKHHIIINAEGIGHSTSMARRIEAATGVETRATILGHMQRGGSPTCKDRVYASMMGAYAVDLLADGKTKRVVGYKGGEFVDYDIDEALAMQKNLPEYWLRVAKALSV